MTDLSDHLLDQINETLTRHKIRHGTLREGPPHLNLNAHDGARVFVKVSRPGERHGHALREVDGAAWANAHGIDAPVAHLDHVVELADESGDLHDLTFWRWITGVSVPALVDQASIVPAFVNQLAALPLPVAAPDFDFEFFLTRVHQRLDDHGDPTARTIIEAAENAADTVRDLLNPDRYVWIHGDLHFLNVHWQVNGQPVLLDWESHCRGPVEWDVAQLLRSVDRDFPQHMDCDKERAFDSVRRIIGDQIDVDWKLVEACGRFRAASSASHLFLHGHNETKLAADLRMMDPDTPYAA